MTRANVINSMYGCDTYKVKKDENLDSIFMKFEDSEYGEYTYLIFTVPSDWVKTLDIKRTWTDGIKEMPMDEWNIKLQILNFAIQQKKIASYKIS